MGISFGSIGTGLPKDIVQQIIRAERIPIEKLQERKGKLESKRALLDQFMQFVGDVRGQLISNRSARSFRELKVSDYDKTLVGIDVDKNIANPGTYQLEVVSLAQKSSAFSNGVEDPDETYLGVGYIGYQLPNGEETEIYIDAENSSLRGVAKLINQNAENGMSATVVNDGKEGDTPWRLIISLNETGDKNKATFPYFYMVDGDEDLFIDQEREGKDAKVKLDGFEIESPGNQLSELIPGLTIDLKRAEPGKEFTVEVVEDVEKISEKVKNIVDSVNKVLGFIKEQNTLDENTDTRSTLGGDLTLQTMEARIRSTVFKFIPTSKGSKRLGDLGVSFQRSGLLKFDESKFSAEMKKDFKSTAEVLVGRIQDGVPVNGAFLNLSELADDALRNPSGVISSRKSGVQSNIDRIDDRIASKERYIANKERVLKDKFARLEETVSQIKSQGQGLAGLSGGANNPVQQLG